MSTQRRPLCDDEVQAVMAVLADKYPRPRTALRHGDPFQLLVATVLSAQSTDRMVNRVTPALFARCPTPEAFLELEPAELERYIRTLGLYRSKARSILKACRVLMEEFDGRVPQTRAELMRLPGVGRKTANVVLANAFQQPAFAVDTHVFRVANRLGLADSEDVGEVERQVTARIPPEQWIPAHHWLIRHGRDTCHARGPRCHACALSPYCRAFREGRVRPAGEGSAPRAGSDAG